MAIVKKYKVIDNFLDIEFYRKFRDILYSEELPWFFRSSYTGDIEKTGTESVYFTHNFFNKNTVSSSLLFKEYISPILKKLNAVSLLQVRANLLLDPGRPTASSFHIDEPCNCKTAILYFTTCDGPTILDKKEKIKIDSVENRLLIFDSSIPHSGTSNKIDRRIVINFNFFDHQGLLEDTNNR